MNIADAPEVLTVEQAAELLGVARGTAYEAVRVGDVPSVRCGRRILIPKHRLVAFLNGESQPRPAGSRDAQDGARHDEP